MHTISRFLISSALFVSTGCSQKSTTTSNPTGAPPIASVTPMNTNHETPEAPKNDPTHTSTSTVLPDPTEPSHSRQVHLEAGEQALRNGNFPAAIDAYLASIQSTSETDLVHTAAHLGLATSYLRSDAIWAATEVLEQFITEHPNSPNIADAIFMLGSAHLTLGNNTTAINHFNRYLQEHPGLIDSYVLELLGDAHRARAEYKIAATHYEQALLADRGGNINFLILDKAESLQAAGEIDTALSLFNLVDKNTKYDATRARMDYERAQAYAARGDYESATSQYSHAVNTYPDNYYAYLSLVELLSYGVPVDDFQRGLVDFYAKQYSPAILAFERYLKTAADHDARVHYYIALSYRELENIYATKTHLLEIIQTHTGDSLWVDAAIELAYTQWGWEQDYSGAIATLLNVVEKSPGANSAPEALFYSGRVAERSADLQLAATLWGRVADEYKNSHLASRAAFLSGISLYRHGEYTKSIYRFQQASSLPNADIDELTSALMWIGKAHSETGDANLATEAWKTASLTDPHGYYGLRASELADGQLPYNIQSQIDFTSSRSLAAQSEAEAWLAIRLGLPAHGLGKLSPQLKKEARWRRGSALWRLGLFDDARDELDSLRKTYQDDALASYQIALSLTDLGYYYGALWAGRHCMDALGLTNPFNAPKFITHLRFGPYYLDLIDPTSTEYDLDPLLIYALIRQESLFQGQVTSSAYAQGLMQVIPPTGDYIARQLRWPSYSNADLYLPYVNVAFGAFYLAEQRDIFDGNMYAALVAYNAGPGNTSIWQQLSGGDYDLLVEIIRLEQPRDYVRRIAEHYAVYRHLYASN